MGPEILYPLLPLCLLHLAWVALGWAKVRRRWLAIPVSALLSAAILVANHYRIGLAFDVFIGVWSAYLFLFVPFLVLRGLVRGVCYVVRLRDDPPPSGHAVDDPRAATHHRSGTPGIPR
jgi:hypothetical protein